MSASGRARPSADEPQALPEPETPLQRAATALGEAVGKLTGAGRGRVDPESAGPHKDAAADADPTGAGPSRPARNVLGGVVKNVAAAAKGVGGGAVLGGTFLSDLLTEAAHRIPLRDAATLRAHHDAQDTELIADELVRAAARVTGGIGGAAGGLAAAQWLAIPTMMAVPVELAAETLLVAAVEIKLVAELHELYGVRPPGDLGERANAYLGSWTSQRGLSGEGQTSGVAAQVTKAGMKALRKRITGRLGRNLGSFLPFLAGAVVGARNNHLSTKRLAERLRGDLSAQPQLVRSERLPTD